MSLGGTASGVAAVLLAVALPVQAADIPRPLYKAVPPQAAFDWAGSYAGINGGSGFDTSNLTKDSASIRSKGALIGGTLGVNRRIGAIVWGLEGDLDWSGAKGREACGAFFCEARNTWLGTVRGRLGRASGRWLPYVTAGVAYGNVTASSTDPAVAEASRVRVGWTAGIGVEHAFAANWSAKIEYLYVCLGDVGRGSACDTGVTTGNVSLKESVIRAGVNYRFHGPLF